MSIFVINAGSSSYKCAIFSKKGLKRLWEGSLSWKEKKSKVLFKTKNHVEELAVPNPEEGLKILLKSIVSKVPIEAVGHRIVHGGDCYTQPTLIDIKVKRAIEKASPLAPVHNESSLKGIEASEKHFPNVPNIAVFDTGFHTTLKESVSTYPGPFQWKKEGYHRFGFHGINFAYCTDRASALLGPSKSKIVICHIGSGISLCAVKNGKSIDTTMGMTPLEGVMMAERSGSLDPGMILQLMQKKKLSPLGLEKILYFQSGLFGISGKSGDVREIIKGMKLGNERCKLAFEMYIHHLKGALGRMIASLEGIDALIFTGGVGEHSAEVRSAICNAFLFCGIVCDKRRNSLKKEGERLLSPSSSPVSVLLIPAQEDFQIAKLSKELMKC